ncbi:MAG: hypothetical protein US53_C0048G0001, partial [Candidatus Woesebacteria bacterium GW2011_GWA1_37_7]
MELNERRGRIDLINKGFSLQNEIEAHESFVGIGCADSRISEILAEI